MKKLFLFTFLLIMAFGGNLFAQPTPPKPTEFELRWQAKRLSKSCFSVTRDQTHKAGAIWWPNKVDLTKPLELNFVVYMGDKNDGGADGLAFVFHNDPKGHEAKGEEGGGLYYGDHPTKPEGSKGYGRPGTDLKIVPSIAIEMDTYKNASCPTGEDPDYDHTSIVYNGETCNPQIITSAGQKFIPLHSTKMNVEDSTCFNAKITWDPTAKELSLFFAGKEDVPVHRFTHKVDLIADIFAGQSMVYYGFTGSTGGLSNEQTICIFEGNSNPVAKDDEASTPYGTPVIVDVQKNDDEDDGDSIFTTKITALPLHGTAEIINNDSIRYSPFAGYAGLDSLQYQIVDINPKLTKPEKCYVNQSYAWVVFNRVKCPTYQLVAAKLKDNEKCDISGEDPDDSKLRNNGQARAYMKDGSTEITNGFVFSWYKGTYATADDVVGLTPAHTGIEITNLEHGNYTVVAKLKDSDECKFDVVLITIGRDQTVPDFEIQLTNATQCEPSNGALAVKFADPSTDLSKYLYRWYEEIPTIISTNPSISNLQPKKYTLIVINKLSGCEAGKDMTVGLTYTMLKIDTTSVPRTSCQDLNGSISASVAGNTSNYDFIWAKGTDPNFLAPIFTGATLTGQEVGTYYVKAKDKTTGCLLAPLEVKMRDGRRSPAITTSAVVNQTSCTSKKNGSITISNLDSGQPLTNYTFEWFAGNNTTNALPAANINNAKNRAINLAAGEYTVRITNNITKCSVTRKFDVIDVLDNPKIVVDLHVNQTHCAPANGSLTVRVDPDKSGPRNPTTNNYTFNWWINGSMTTNPPVFTGNVYNQLPAGTYYVQAISNNGCVADSVIVIDDNTSAPEITLTATNNTSCDPNQPNGRVDAVVGNVPVGTSIKYEWFEGNNTTSLIGSAVITTNTTQTLSGLKLNDYTLRVTNQTTGCFVTKFVKVEKVITPPFVVTANATVANCISATGTNATLTANVGGNTSDYDFLWYEGDQVKNAADFTGHTVAGKKPGDYLVVAVHKTNHCESPAVPVTINYVAPYTAPIAISGSIGDCVTSTAYLTATPSVPGTYTYTWYQGIADLPYYPYFSPGRTPLSSTTETLTPVTPDVYSVVVRNSSGCAVVEKYDLSLMSSVPGVVLKAVKNNTHCTTPNGAVEIDYIVPDPLTSPLGRVYPGDPAFASYKIYWINGFTAPTTLPATYSNSPAYTGLALGQYGVIVDIGSVCNTPFTTANVANAFSYPNLTLSRVNQTNCPPSGSGILPNGSIQIDINNYSGNPAHYSYSVTKDGAPYPVSIPFANPLIIPNLGVGSYSIQVLNETNCPTTRTIVIADDHVTPTGTVSVINQINCVNPDGSISVDPYATPVNHTYNWFNKETGAAVGAGTPLTNQQFGKYYLIITDNDTHCQSNMIDGEILDKRVYPTLSAIDITPKTECGNDLDGTATLVFGPKMNSDDYYITWTLPPGVATPSYVASINSQLLLTNLDSGKYIVKFEDKVTGCSTETFFQVGLNQNKPQLTLTATDNTQCPSNGTLTASIVPGTGTNPVAPIKWARIIDGVVTAENSYENILSHTNVAPGEYLVWAESDGKDCESLPVQVKIEDKTPKVQINLEELLHQSSCDYSVPNGMIKIAVEPAGSYDYRWFTTGNALPIASGTDVTSISNLAAGEYRVEITVNGCVFEETFTIRNQKHKFVPVIAKQNVTRCVAPYDGLLAASVNGGTNGYTFTWTHLDSSTPYASAEAKNLPTGNYSLHVQHDETTCDTTLFVTLNFEAQPFDILVIEDKPVTHCDMDKANGQMSVRVNGQVSGFQYDWYETANITATTPIAFSGSTFNELKAVTYTVRVINVITGCVKDQQVTPLHLPIQVPAPSIVTYRNVTSCISPNGYAEVTVGGNNANHIFHWYAGNQLKSTPDYEGYFAENLAIGDYLVTATDRLSGCVSAPLKVTIGDEKVFVDIKASIKNSLCHSNNGEATITWIEPVGVSTIVLSNDMESMNGDVFTDLPYGDFHVRLETVEGCVSEKDITIGADWLVYNGVSPNGDGMNDKLSIDCIELFPNNKVKIFNRAGALVYVGEGYNNDSVYFEGLGNRGIYVTGNYLPDGTYYYVVDPGDGSKPSAGFFELLR